MNWLLLIFAVLCAGIGAGLLWWRQRMGKERALMAATPTSKASEVAKLSPGSIVEVKGTLRCPKPLTGEFSKQSCAYFLAEIKEEETYYATDSQGRRERRTTTRTVHTNRQSAPCVVEDNSGNVALAIEGAEVEGKQSFSKREAAGGNLLSTLTQLAGGGRGELLYEETVLPYDVPIYVLGEVQANGAVGKPAANSKNTIFVVSIKSEEERNKSLGRSMFWVSALAGILFIAAVVLLFYAVKTG